MTLGQAQLLVIVAFLAIVVVTAATLKWLRVEERLQKLSPAAGSRLMAILWVGTLAIITCVMLFAPCGGGRNGQLMVVKVIVVAISWLIAFFAFTPLGRRLGEKRLLPEKVARIATVLLLLLILAAFILAASMAGGGGLVSIIIAAVLILFGWQVTRDLTKTRKQTRKKRNAPPRDGETRDGNP